MLDAIITGTEITLEAFLICTAVSLALGLGTALLCMYRGSCTQSFVVTLAMLPAVVQVIIMLVNGNTGAGVAVAGAFGPVRFRSTPGTAREIGMIFLSMALGLGTGMGFVALSRLNFGGGSENERVLKIAIPENLDYEGLFDDLLLKYTRSARLERVKTSNMGTLFELDYRVVLKDGEVPKEFLDALRCRNGNLNIVCGRVDSVTAF